MEEVKKDTFIEVAKERYESPSSPWWNTVGYIAGPLASGMSFVMTIDGLPKWSRYIISFVIGFATWFVPTKFGTTNKTTANK
jgi:hypothetical protein